MKKDEYKKMLNELWYGKGSIAEQRENCKKIKYADLITLAPYNYQAKEELEERKHKRLLFWAVSGVILTLIVILLMLIQK